MSGDGAGSKPVFVEPTAQAVCDQERERLADELDAAGHQKAASYLMGNDRVERLEARCSRPSRRPDAPMRMDEHLAAELIENHLAAICGTLARWASSVDKAKLAIRAVVDDDMFWRTIVVPPRGPSLYLEGDEDDHVHYQLELSECVQILKLVATTHCCWLSVDVVRESFQAVYDMGHVWDLAEQVVRHLPKECRPVPRPESN